MHFDHHKRVFLGFFFLFLALAGVAYLSARGIGGTPSAPVVAGAWDILPAECRDPAQVAARKCDAYSFLRLINNIIKILLRIVFVVSPILIAYGGIVILTAGAAGGSEQITKGKAIIKAAVIGIIIALIAFLLVRLVFALFGITPESVSVPSQQLNP